jgi:hypothetical protein
MVTVLNFFFQCGEIVFSKSFKYTAYMSFYSFKTAFLYSPVFSVGVVSLSPVHYLITRRLLIRYWTSLRSDSRQISCSSPVSSHV